MAVLKFGEIWNRQSLLAEQKLLLPVVRTEMLSQCLSDRMRRGLRYGEENESMMMRNNQVDQVLPNLSTKQTITRTATGTVWIPHDVLCIRNAHPCCSMSAITQRIQYFPVDVSIV